MNIDTDKLSLEVDKINEISIDFELLLEELKNKNNELNDYWSSNTKDKVYNNFDKFYQMIENLKETLDDDKEFLEEVVNASYIEEEISTNNLIDEKIAI
jgi:uncharacterized protein YukE